MLTLIQAWWCYGTRVGASLFPPQAAEASEVSCFSVCLSLSLDCEEGSLGLCPTLFKNQRYLQAEGDIPFPSMALSSAAAPP